jgi:hypothetical protein
LNGFFWISEELVLFFAEAFRLSLPYEKQAERQCEVSYRRQGFGKSTSQRTSGKAMKGRLFLGFGHPRGWGKHRF